MRTVRFTPARPGRYARRWTRRWMLLGKTGKWLGITFGAVVGLFIAVVLCTIGSAMLLSAITTLFSAVS